MAPVLVRAGSVCPKYMCEKIVLIKFERVECDLIQHKVLPGYNEAQGIRRTMCTLKREAEPSPRC